MKRIIAALLIVLALSSQLSAQDNAPAVTKQFMQITTIESVVAGGLGRSRMLITESDGSQKDVDLENLFSMGGINFKNIKSNEDKILRMLKSYTDQGWNLDHSTSLTLSPSESGGNGIFMTRYLLSKGDQKKGF